MRSFVVVVGLGLAACTCQPMALPDAGGGVGGGEGGGGASAGGMAQPTQPTWPDGAELAVSNVTSTNATLNWPEATDDVAVTEYVLTRDGAEVARGPSRTFAVTALREGDFAAFRVVARDGDGNASAALRAFVTAAPTLEVPASDTSISTDFCAAMQFLFTGPNALQRNVDATKVPCTTLAVIHGRVRSAGGSPIPGVAVSIVDKPEFGSTLTRGDGQFDLAVSAGTHVVQLTTPVFLPVHRRVVATRARLTTLDDDVVLLPTDEAATTVELPAGGLHTATLRRDASGTRQVRLYIPPGTSAVAELRDGGTQALPRVTVRVTEYTVGPSGPNAMPAQLPESSAYTFAAEFTVDEAVALGATGVRFSGPVATWVDNFLNSPLCTQVPQGRYDARQMRWVSEPASLVVATAPGGLDVTGDGVADSDGRLLEGEAMALASAFPVGTSLVRTLSTHFSPRDDNYPWQCDGTCQGSSRKVPEKAPRGCTQQGSIIDCHNQTVSESWPVPGTGLSLELHSHRQPQGSFRLDVPLGTDVDGGVQGALAGRIILDIAGQRLVAQVPDAGEGTTLSVTWDGKDALGRAVRGPVEATLEAGFTFGRRNVSAAPAGGSCSGELLRYGATASSFGNVPVEGAASAGPARDVRFFSNSQTVLLGTWVGAEDLGGLSLGILHGSSASTGTLFMGNGLFSREADIGATARLYAGGGRTRLDSVPARDAQLNQAAHLVAGPDGSLYFVDNGTSVRRVTPDGARVEAVAGAVGAGTGFSGDGASARMARFSAIDGLAVASNGDVYIADTGNHRIRRVEASTGLVTTVAGTGVVGVPPNGSTAAQAPLNSPRTMVWGSDNKLYFFTYTGTGSGDLLFRLADGVLERVGGGVASSPPPPAESDSAHRVAFSTFGKRMAQGPDGSLYITDNRSRVRRVTPSGRVELVAGDGRQVQDGERGRATQFGDVMGVAVDSVGLVYVADRGGAPGRMGGSIRVVGPDGRVTTVAGTGALPSGPAPDVDKPGTAVDLGESREVAILPDGRVAYAENRYGTIQVLQRAWDLGLGERGVGSEDGNEVYVFDASGRHLRTLETLTGAVVWRFGWDASGRLASVTDRNGDVTTVLRDAQGRFEGLRARDGQVTQVTLDAEGRVASLTDAASRTVRITWNQQGLPASWEDEERGVTRFGYDDVGRLVSETDANGGVKTVRRDETKFGYTVSYSTPEGRLTRYDVSESGRFRLYTNTFPDGFQTVSRASGGREATWFPDGTVVDTSLASDSRFGSQTPYLSFQQTRLPSGLTLGVGAERRVTLDGGAVLALARLEEVTSVNNTTWRRVYTANDRTWRATSPVGRVSTVTLDEKGRPVTWTAPGVVATQVTYDGRGRPTRVQQGSRWLDVTYGPNGFADTLTDALARTTRLASDVTGQLNSATRPDMEVYGFGWDARGNLTSLTPPGKPAHGFSYSKLNEVTDYTPPMVAGVGNEVYRWTRDSEVASVTHPDGTTSTVTRDAAGRATRVVSPWATATLDYSSMTGQATSSTRDGQRLDWRYDGMLLVAEASSGVVPGTVSYRHDAFFRVTSVAVNDAGVSYAYDNDGLLTSAGPVTLARSLTTGQLQTATTGGVATSYTYDAYGAPASLETRVSGTPVFREVLTWDDIGRVTGKDVTVQGVTTRWAYAYDGASRLTQARRDGTVVGTWTYDGNGNRLTSDTETSTFDAQDRQLTAGATTFSHDAFGNRTRKTEGAQVTQYVYDGVGGLLSATLPDGTRLEYVIDARGRRVAKRRNGALEKGWLYDGQLRIIAETDASGAVVSRFIYGTLSHSPDVMLRGGVVYRYVHDVLGSVRLVINTATGQVVQRLDYDSWGVVTADSSPGFQSFAFAGGLYDGDTRLTRFGARDYDATTGRWTAKDPIGFRSGTTSLYEFVSNKPISHIDPSGLDVLPTAGDRDLWNGVSRLRSTKTGKDLYDYLHKSRPERIPLSSMKAEFVSGDMQGWINGRTRFIRRGKRIFAACYAVTDPGDIGTEADPALNIAEELAHVRALIDFPRMGDALRDKYVDHIVYRIAQELGVSYAPSHIHSAP